MTRVRPTGCWTVRRGARRQPGNRSGWSVDEYEAGVPRGERLMGDQVVPGGYGDLLARSPPRSATTRLRAARSGNTELAAVLADRPADPERQESRAVGLGVIRRLSTDLRREFPDMKGLSPTNLQYMRAFAAAWPDRPNFPTQPWGNCRGAMSAPCSTRSRTPALRDWYADRDVGNGWSRPVSSTTSRPACTAGSGPHPATSTEHLDPARRRSGPGDRQGPLRLRFPRPR